MTQERVIAVVVTHNRRELLVEALDSISTQSRAADGVVVIDNASTDGTADQVRERYPDVALRSTSRNIGGAGGFALGIATALDLGADLIWLMDDDTVPTTDALAELLSARARYDAGPPALVASRVVWTDGRDHPMNTPRPKPMVRHAEIAAAERCGCLPIRSASFVSILVDASVCLQRGLPIADYFLWNDDFEFTTRLLRDRPGLLCSSSVVVHKTRTFGSTDADPGERFFFEVRNKIWMLIRSPSLAPLERLVYTGSTLRRWVRTLAASPDRRLLVRAMRRGIIAAVRSAPRDTDEILGRAGGT
jgi:rhamnopyranosyl-N-acetylglucosaminyl-diphospho-decaprenol beta-1,3/1,4-galactofuranosyltransferase